MDEHIAPNWLHNVGLKLDLSDTARKLLIAYSTCEKAVMSVYTLEAGIYDALFYGGVITYYSSLGQSGEQILRAYLTYPNINYNAPINQSVLKQFEKMDKEKNQPTLPYPLLPHNAPSNNDRLWQIYTEWKDIRNKTIAHTDQNHKYRLSSICIKMPPSPGEQPEPYPYANYLSNVKGWPLITLDRRQEFLSLISVTATIFLVIDGVYEKLKDDKLI